MNAMKKELVNKVPVGCKIKLFLINNKQVKGTVISYSDDTFLLFKLSNGEEKPFNYNMIGDWEPTDEEGIPIAIPNNQHKFSESEQKNQESESLDQEKGQSASEIKNIISMFDIKIKCRAILTGLQVERQECNILIGNFEEAQKAHELAPRFTGVNRMDGIINRMGRLIQNNQDRVEFKKILCLMLLETLKIGEFSYIDKVNQILCSSINESSCDDFVLCALIGQIVTKTKNYEIVFCLAEKCNEPVNDNIIKLFVFILNSVNINPSLVNHESLFSAENYSSLYSQISENFPRNTIKEVQVEQRPNSVAGKVNGVDTSPERQSPDGNIGFIDRAVPRAVPNQIGLWVILALDGNTYTFLETDVEDADVFKILKNPALWQNQSFRFDIETIPNGKKVAKRIQIGDSIKPRPSIKRIYASKNDSYNNKRPYPSQPSLKISELADAKHQYSRKNYGKALELYKEGLKKAKQSNNNYSVVESVQQIVQLYIKNGGIDDLNNAEKTLSENKNFLFKSNYYTLLIQICEKFGKLGNEEKLLSAIEEGIKETDSEKTVLYFILRKAYILQARADGDFRTVVDTLNQWIISAEKILKASNAADAQKIMSQKDTVLMMAAGYISGIRAQIPDYVVSSPLKESIEKNSAASQKMNEIYIEKKEDDIVVMDQWDILFYDSVNAISPFVKSKLNNYNLTENIRINLIDDQGKFIGTVSEAIQEYKKTIVDRKVSTLEPVKRYEEYLKAARILFDALTNRDNPIINEDERKEAWKFFSFSLGKSFVSFGDYAVKDLDFPLDTARYYYYEGLKYLIDESDSQDKHNTATRMVLSFFLERSRIPLPSYGQDTSKNLSYNHLSQLISGEQIKESQINEFINLFFQFLSEDIFKNDWYWFLKPILQSKIDISNRLNELFKNRTVSVIGIRSINEKELNELLAAIKKIYLGEKKKFLTALNSLDNFSFSPNWLSTIDKTIKRLNVFRPYMLQCDIKYLERIIVWISRAYEYNDNTDSDRKRELLLYIISGVDSMTQDINKVPSKLAFENFLGKLPHFREQAMSAFSTLCETNPPDITIELSGEKEVRMDNGKVFIQINVKNKHDSLMADSLSLKIEDSEKFSIVEHDRSSVYIRGGDSKLFQFSLQVRNNADKVLKLRIKAVYARTKAIDENIQEEKIEEITVALTDEKFKIIDNPYEKYAGGRKVEDVKMFFGRGEFIDKIVSHLINQEGKLLKQECILLYGQKRTGKSSILMHLKENIAEKSKNSIIVDLEDISVHSSQNLDTVFARQICKTLKETLQNDHAELYKALVESNITIPEIDFSNSAEIARAELNDFFHDLTLFFERKSLEQDYNIVIMIDEFTAIYSWIQQKRLNDDFMPFWKGFINNNKLVGILAGKDTMSDFIEAYSNAFGAINKNLVTYLPEAESERMIEDPPAKNKLMFEGDTGEKAIKRIRELSADSAWFNMILLNRLVVYMNEKQRRWVSDADINTLCKEKIFGDSNHPLKIDVFEPLYDDGDKADNLRLMHNLIILYSIANSGAYNGSCNQEKITINPDFNEPIDDVRKDEIITRLISRDVLERDTNYNLKIKVGLFYDWLTQYCSPKTINDFIKRQVENE
jgi:hypothetical protein